MKHDVKKGDCIENLKKIDESIHLTFLDPPFNQGKKYNQHNDNLSSKEYWGWMQTVCQLVYEKTVTGGAIYFMQREKNTDRVMQVLKKSGWTFKNLIIWKKKTSAVPMQYGYGKHFQVIVFAIKGKKPRIFNRLRIDPPLTSEQTIKRENGIYVTDVWDDIRELTSGYFAGSEPLRDKNGERLHKQQSPIKLLTRIILSSTNIDDMVLDPFAGTGTTLVVAKQLLRNSIGIEIDSFNVDLIEERLGNLKESDDISNLRNDYLYTDNLENIWKSDAPLLRNIYQSDEITQQAFDL